MRVSACVNALSLTFQCLVIPAGHSFIGWGTNKLSDWFIDCWLPHKVTQLVHVIGDLQSFKLVIFPPHKTLFNS